VKYDKNMETGGERSLYLQEIQNRLRTINVKKILLFGSSAKGDMHEDSDIDLLVVLDEDYTPQTYDEWMEVKLKVRRILRDINEKIAIDLLVYTNPQYEQLLDNMNSFQREIHKNGRVLYEKAS
jgi:predicted nucleotidyltransferase